MPDNTFGYKIYKLNKALLPLMKLATFIGVLCGLLFAGMGVARMFGLIDMGREFEGIEPIWMLGGGLGLSIGAVMGYKFKIKGRLDKMKAMYEPDEV